MSTVDRIWVNVDYLKDRYVGSDPILVFESEGKCAVFYNQISGAARTQKLEHVGPVADSTAYSEQANIERARDPEIKSSPETVAQLKERTGLTNDARAKSRGYEVINIRPGQSIQEALPPKLHEIIGPDPRVPNLLEHIRQTLEEGPERGGGFDVRVLKGLETSESGEGARISRVLKGVGAGETEIGYAKLSLEMDFEEIFGGTWGKKSTLLNRLTRATGLASLEPGLLPTTSSNVQSLFGESVSAIQGLDALSYRNPNNLVFFDLETTGLRQGLDRPLTMTLKWRGKSYQYLFPQQLTGSFIENATQGLDDALRLLRSNMDLYKQTIALEQGSAPGWRTKISQIEQEVLGVQAGRWRAAKETVRRIGNVVRFGPQTVGGMAETTLGIVESGQTAQQLAGRMAETAGVFEGNVLGGIAHTPVDPQSAARLVSELARVRGVVGVNPMFDVRSLAPFSWNMRQYIEQGTPGLIDLRTLAMTMGKVDPKFGRLLAEHGTTNEGIARAVQSFTGSDLGIDFRGTHVSGVDVDITEAAFKGMVDTRFQAGSRGVSLIPRRGQIGPWLAQTGLVNQNAVGIDDLVVSMGARSIPGQRGMSTIADWTDYYGINLESTLEANQGLVGVSKLYSPGLYDPENIFPVGRLRTYRVKSWTDNRLVLQDLFEGQDRTLVFRDRESLTRFTTLNLAKPADVRIAATDQAVASNLMAVRGRVGRDIEEMVFGPRGGSEIPRFMNYRVGKLSSEIEMIQRGLGREGVQFNDILTPLMGRGNIEEHATRLTGLARTLNANYGMNFSLLGDKGMMLTPESLVQAAVLSEETGWSTIGRELHRISLIGDPGARQQAGAEAIAMLRRRNLRQTTPLNVGGLEMAAESSILDLAGVADDFKQTLVAQTDLFQSTFRTSSLSSEAVDELMRSKAGLVSSQIEEWTRGNVKPLYDLIDGAGGTIDQVDAARAFAKTSMFDTYFTQSAAGTYSPTRTASAAFVGRNPRIGETFSGTMVRQAMERVGTPELVSAAPEFPFESRGMGTWGRIGVAATAGAAILMAMSSARKIDMLKSTHGRSQPPFADGEEDPHREVTVTLPMEIRRLQNKSTQIDIDLDRQDTETHRLKIFLQKLKYGSWADVNRTRPDSNSEDTIFPRTVRRF